jgi:hypothetical protein
MPDRRCCCEGCWEVSDNFNRADSTYIGPVLTELRGDSSIDSTELLIPGGVSNGALVYSAEQGSRTSGIVYATINGTVEDAIYRIALNFNKDTGEGLWGQLKQNATSIEISTSVTPPEVKATRYPGATYDLMLCFTGLGEMTGTLGTSTEGMSGGLLNFVWDMSIWDTWGPAWPKDGGYRAALINPGTEDIKFDDFKYQEHQVTDPTCPDCGCSCDYYAPPTPCIRLTFWGTGCMSALNGTTAVMEMVTDTDIGGTPVYDAEDVFLCSWGPYTFAINCDGPDPYDWQLSVRDQYGSPVSGIGPNATFPRNPDAASCDPFSMSFGPWYAEEDPGLPASPCCTAPGGTGSWGAVLTVDGCTTGTGS